MKKLKSINGIPLSYIQSILKIDPLSPSGLAWLPRKNMQFNSYCANKAAGGQHKSTINQYKSWVVTISYKNNTKRYTCSRIIFLLTKGYLTKGKFIDHQDNNALNNNPDNLRESTKGQNAQNRGMRSDNSSGHKNVFWHKEKDKWHVRIRKNGKCHYLGFYVNLEDAIKVAIEARKKLHGEFGRDE